MNLNMHKRALLVTAISSALGVSLYVPTALAVLPQIQTGYGYSLVLRDDGTLFQYGNEPLIPITLPSSSSVPYQPNTAILSNVVDITNGNSSGGSTFLSNGSSMCWSPTTDNNYQNMTTTPTICFSVSGETAKQIVKSGNNDYYALTQSGKVYKWEYNFGSFSTPQQLPINDPVVQMDGQYFFTQNGTNSAVYFSFNGTSGKITTPEPIISVKNQLALGQSGKVYQLNTWNSPPSLSEVAGLPAIKSFPKDSYYNGIGTDGKLYQFVNGIGEIGISDVKEAWGNYSQGIALTNAGKVFSYSHANWNPMTYTITEISNLSNVKEIKGSSWRFNALTNSGEVFYVENNNAVQAGGISDATLISDPSWYGHSLVMKRDGTLCGWGNNDRGQLSSFVTSTFVDVSSPICGLEDLIVNTSSTSCIAEYKPQEPRTVSIKAIDLPILNDITGKEIGKYLTCKGDLALLRGAMDLTIKGETFSCDPVPTLGNISNARYKFADSTLQIPCVSIPSTIRLPAGILIQGPTDYFSATLQLMPTDANFGVFTVIDFKPMTP